MQIYFIRHGQSENNQLWTEKGSERERLQDPHLSELGMRQAALLGQYLHSGNKASPLYLNQDMHNVRGFGLTHIYASLMWRAIETAVYTAEQYDLPIYGLELIHEGGGIYLEDPTTGERNGQLGKTPEELRAGFPRLQLEGDINPTGWWNRPYEAHEARVPRAKRALEWLLARHSGQDDRIALFSHGAFYNYFVTAMSGLDQRLSLWLDLNNCAISRFDVRSEGISLVYHNKVDYLPTDWVS